MNTQQISSALKNIKEFLGVFPSDKLPKSIQPPAALIANTDPQSKPGKHWVAFFIDHDRSGEYFDSYGQQPCVKSFQTFLSRNSNNQLHNNQRIQGPLSSVCGQYCIYYIFQRVKDFPMCEIVRAFDSQDLVANDESVTEFVNDNFSVNLETYDVEFILNQICVANP